tara:strand:- start:22746 stop:23186 length:441 start_codon:yes stop_codon:yes gene_type:complete
MKKLPRPAVKPPRENTIALINIVFLMLIFFLIAGTIAPPLDNDVELIKSSDADPAEPPHALFITEEGALRFQGKSVTPESYIALAREQGIGTDSDNGDPDATQEVGLSVKIAADGKLPATGLIAVIDQLKNAGAGKITIITERKTP